MESSTKQEQIELPILQEPVQLLDEYERVIAAIPLDLEITARETRALVRRREVRRAIDLLRMVLAYAICDWSLRMVGAWCLLKGIGNMSDVAVLKRLRKCNRWLGELIAAMLLKRRLRLTSMPGVRIRLIDATALSQPGSRGTDWRVHLSMDLGHLCIDEMQVTDVSGGETLNRFMTRPGEIVIADRGLATAKGLGPVLASKAWLVVRITWRHLWFEAAPQQPFDLIQWLHSVDGPEEQQVWLRTPQGRFALRVLACPLPPEKAEKARQRVRRIAKSRGRTPNKKSLFMAGYMVLITNLPNQTWDIHQLFALYRIRWQVELLFKRLKSLLNLDGLRAQDPDLAQTYLLGKLLAALLLDEFITASSLLCPQWFLSPRRPASLWRLTTLFQTAFQHLVCGNIHLLRVFLLLPELQRYLCDAPRKRRQQLAWARFLFCNSFAC